MMTSVILLAAMLGADPSPGITAHICCFHGTDGHARVALYNDGDVWLKPGKFVSEQVIALKGPKLDVVFPGVPKGRYAIAVVHDENDNGKLDMKWLPFPHPGEGVGMSNDAKGTLGPPKFADAAFDFAGSGVLSLSINLVY